MSDEERLKKFKEIKQKIFVQLILEGMEEEKAEEKARAQAAIEFKQFEDEEKEKNIKRKEKIKEDLLYTFKKFGTIDCGVRKLTDVERMCGKLNYDQPELKVSLDEGIMLADQLVSEGKLTSSTFNDDGKIKYKYCYVEKK